VNYNLYLKRAGEERFFLRFYLTEILDENIDLYNEQNDLYNEQIKLQIKCRKRICLLYETEYE
jgi:hypothetical protein